MSFDPYGQPIVKQRSPAPIVLLVLLLLASGGANYWLWTERQRATSEAKAAVSKLAAEEASFTEMKQKVEMLQTENADLTEAKKQLAKDVEAKSGSVHVGTLDAPPAMPQTFARPEPHRRRASNATSVITGTTTSQRAITRSIYMADGAPAGIKR